MNSLLDVWDILCRGWVIFMGSFPWRTSKPSSGQGPAHRHQGGGGWPLACADLQSHAVISGFGDVWTLEKLGFVQKWSHEHGNLEKDRVEKPWDFGALYFQTNKYDGHDSPKLPWPCTGSSHATPALEGQRSAFQRNAAHSRGFQASGLQETNLKRSKRDQIWQMVCITFGNLEMICNPVIFDCYP